MKTPYEKLVTVENTTHCFRKCAILPCNKFTFTYLHFAPSEVHLITSANINNGVMAEAEKCGVVEEEEEEAENVAQQNGNFRAQIVEPRETR
jgi:hypothetical protein